MPSQSVPAGGPSTINGVLYQMLWSLFRTTALHVAQYRVDPGSGDPSAALLKLEPIGGGGDLQEKQPSARFIDQVKSRADGSTWSLAELVVEVLPDLYRAVNVEDNAVRYRLVTEGRIGRWGRAYEFFGSLRYRTYDPSALDDTTTVFSSPRAKPDSLWRESAHTERSLFDVILESIQSVPGVEEESSDVTSLKLWHLLSHFEFVGDRGQAAIQQEIDHILLAMVDHDHELASKRDAMLTDLARRAASGDATIHLDEFMLAHELDSIPWTQWNVLCQRSRDLLDTSLERRRYVAARDVRHGAAREAVAQWPAHSPLLLVTGETGQGKSWCLYAAVRELSSYANLVVFSEATGDFDRDMGHVADACRAIRNTDQTVPLDRIAARLRALACFPKEGPWLTLAIDGVQDYEEARQLALAPWETWGVRVIVSCQKEIGDCIEKNAFGRYRTLAVSDFTSGELYAYLSQGIGHQWTALPGDVRSTLRRPLLASIFCEEVSSDGDWTPEHEYELYDAMWRRLSVGPQTPFPQDAVCLKMLAATILDDKPYPWPADSTASAGLDNNALMRLCKVGWLRKTDRWCFEIPHDRLLNWAVAESLVAAHAQGCMGHEKFLDVLRLLYHGERVHSGRSLGYVPMDVVWMLTSRDGDDSGTVEDIVEVLQPQPSHESGLFYSELLSTIGPRMTLPLISRLRKVSDKDSFLVGQIISGITSLGSPDLPEQARALLMDDSPRLQRAAMRLLGNAATARALDRLWLLHVAAEKDPGQFLGPHEHNSAVYRDSMRALTACLKLDPSWIERAIIAANAEEEPVHDLAYLLAGIDGGQSLWQACKPHLMAKVSPARERCLARCIYRHRDIAEVSWLLARIDRHDDLVGASCLQALAAIQPDLAIANLSRLPTGDLYMTRGWAVRELLLRHPEDTPKRLLATITASGSPWTAAEVYQGSEDAMDVPTLEYLIDQFENLLQQIKETPQQPNRRPLWGALSVLAAINAPDLLACLGRRADSSVERLLVEWMNSREPRASIGVDHEGQLGLAVLYRFGGPGFVEVLNHYLQADSRYGRLDGIKLAGKRYNGLTRECLRQIVNNEALWDEKFALEQDRAARSLAIQEDWPSVIDAFKKWGIKTSQDLAHAVYEARLDGHLAELTKAARASFQDDPKLSANIFLLGLLGVEESAASIQVELELADPASEVAIACILALGYLNQGDKKTVDLLTQHLVQHRHVAANALFRIGKPQALQAMMADVRSRPDIEYVFPLLPYDETRHDAMCLLRNVLKSCHGFDLKMKLPLIANGTEFELLAAICNEQAIRERIREEAFADEGGVWVGGSKAASVRCLATFDKQMAFLAAGTALRNDDAHDRPRYASLLMEIDNNRAAEVIIEQAGREESVEVRRSLGRALSQVDVVERLSQCVLAGDATARLAACCLLPWQNSQDRAYQLLHDMLDDKCEAVAEAGKRGMEYLSRRRRAEELMTNIAAAKADRDRWWVLLDSAIALADPGDEHGPWPQWARDVCRNEPYLVRLYIGEQLKSRRKELAKDK